VGSPYRNSGPPSTLLVKPVRTPLNPIKALYWSAVINGVVAVPVMIAMMHMTGNPQIMRPFRIHDGVRLMGWLTTAVMAVAAVIMCVATVF
jgi:Mn2+/Fe2+ NRAMP family transporter